MKLYMAEIVELHLIGPKLEKGAYMAIRRSMKLKKRSSKFK